MLVEKININPVPVDQDRRHLGHPRRRPIRFVKNDYAVTSQHQQPERVIEHMERDALANGGAQVPNIFTICLINPKNKS